MRHDWVTNGASYLSVRLSYPPVSSLRSGVTSVCFATTHQLLEQPRNSVGTVQGTTHTWGLAYESRLSFPNSFHSLFYLIKFYCYFSVSLKSKLNLYIYNKTHGCLGTNYQIIKGLNHSIYFSICSKCILHLILML